MLGFCECDALTELSVQFNTRCIVCPGRAWAWPRHPNRSRFSWFL